MSTPEEAKKLIEIYSKAKMDLIRTIAEKEANGNVTWYQKSLLAQINDQLRELDEKAKLWIEKAIPESYNSGVEFVNETLKAGAFSSSFSALHTKAIEELMLEALDELHGANNFLEKRIISAVKKAGIDAVAQKLAQGQTIKQCKKLLIDELISQGLNGIEAKDGRMIPIETYAETVARSKTREATNTATLNQLKNLGYDLVKITSHNSSCPICAPLQGRVYSISGEDERYPPFKFAFTGPYANIHPNCSHVLVPYVEALADDPEEDRKYSNLPFDTDPRSKEQMDLYNEVQKRKRKLRENRRQWERYSFALPDDTPKSFSAFQNMKRSNSEKWNELQATYREITQSV